MWWVRRGAFASRSPRPRGLTLHTAGGGDWHREYLSENGCSRKPGETTALCWRLLKEERQNSTRWHSQAFPDWNAQQAQATEVTTASCRSVLSREGRGHAWWRRVGVRGWKQDDLYFSWLTSLVLRNMWERHLSTFISTWAREDPYRSQNTEILISRREWSPVKPGRQSILVLPEVLLVE